MVEEPRRECCLEARTSGAHRQTRAALMAFVCCGTLPRVRGQRIDDELWTRPAEAVNRFLVRTRGAHVCELPVLDAKKLTPKALEEMTEPTLLTGLAEGSAWLRPDAQHWGREAFLRTYGDHRVRVNTARYDPEKGDVMTTVRKYIEAASSTNLSLVAVGYDTNLESELLWNSEADIPTALEDFDYRPVVQLASALASGTGLHRHYETWLAALYGRKAWWVASRAHPPPSAVAAEEKTHTKHPCSWLDSAAPKGLTFCVQRPGDIMFLGEWMMHATCNLDEYVLGIGGQGHLPKSWTGLDRAFHRGRQSAVEALSKPRDLIRSQPLSTGGFASGSTPLYMVAKKGFLHLASYLIEQRADVQARGHREVSPIGAPEKTYVIERPVHIAAIKGHVEVTRLLAESSAEVNAKDSEGVTPLHHAVQGGDLELSEYLIERRAKVSAADSKKVQPLHWAAYHGHMEIAELILRRRAKLDARTNVGLRPVHRAASGGHAALLAMFQGRGASFESALLHAAAGEGHRSVMRFLLTQRAAVDSPDQGGSRPVEGAVKGGYVDISEMLLHARADVDAVNRQKEPLLLFAAQAGHAALVDLLLQQRASMEAADQEGSQALHVAAVSGHLKLSQLLIRRRAEVDAQDNAGQQPLVWAAMTGHLAAAKLLLKSKCQVNAASPSGHRALTSAAQNGHYAVSKLLVSKGANVFGSDIAGASQYGHERIAKFLQSQSREL